MVTIHGLSGYTNKGCRCGICREAQRVYFAKRRERLAASGLCYECRRPVESGSRYCAEHRARNNARSRTHRLQRRGAELAAIRDAALRIGEGESLGSAVDYLMAYVRPKGL